MYMKAFIAYRLRELITADALEEALQPLQPIPKLQARAVGWVPPFEGAPLVWRADPGLFVLRFQIDEKILPKASIARLVKEELAKQSAPITKALKAQVTDEVLHRLLPDALVKTSTIFVFFDVGHRLMLVGTNSETKAADVTYTLRKELGDLPVHRLATNKVPAQEMATWMRLGPPSHVCLEPNVVLRESNGSTGTVRIKGIDLESETVHEPLRAGAEVQELGLTYNDKTTFVLTDILTVKGLKFTDVMNEVVAEVGDEKENAQLYIEARSYGPLANVILAWFGGETAKDMGDDDDDI